MRSADERSPFLNTPETDTGGGVPTQTKRIQKWLVVSTALGIMSVGVIVAIVSIVPFYGHLKSQEERNLKLALNTKTMAVEEYLSRARDVALQITSRTTARQKLEDYNKGLATRDEVAEYTRNVLLDAMANCHEVWSVTRLDARGNYLVHAGLSLPEEYKPSMDPQQKIPQYYGPVTIQDRSFLMIVSPIINRNSNRVGTDIILFRLFQLERIIQDYTGLGTTGETMLGVIRDDRVELIFPFRTRKTSVSEIVSLDSPIGQAVSKAVGMHSGIVFPSGPGEPNHVIAYGPIRGLNWGILVRMDRDELYEPVYSYIVATCNIIIILLLLGTLGMVLLVRPLTGKMIIRADELEREVQAKTADLQRELAGRTRMEQWLRDSERRYRTLVEEVPDVIFVLDQEGRFSYVNTQVEKFLNQPVYRILETHLSEHVEVQDRGKVELMLHMGSEVIWDEEVAVVDSRGNRKFARIRCKSSLDEPGGAIRFEGVMRDITRRRHLEEELKSSREELLEKIKIIDDLYEHIVQSGKSKAIADHTAEVAHELRQPLAIIGGFARRMARQFDECSTAENGTQRESCNIMISEVQRLERILKGLIDFTRHENIRLQNMNPNEVIDRVLHVYEARMKEKNLLFDVSLGTEVDEIPLDPNRFEQVVRNIVSNAIEASPAGDVIHVTTGVFAASGKAQETGGLQSESYFEIKIRNHGNAIPPDDLEKIFSPFFTTKNYGTGIGLTISKKIVEEHRGSISVKSDAEGTAFTVWLPLHETHET
ncbi:MAG TPA: ATP-binding protein [Desulfomonilaceae bacterium]|nr:ATP-binding protein [Desulfomonilaceae bacterium]